MVTCGAFLRADVVFASFVSLLRGASDAQLRGRRVCVTLMHRPIGPILNDDHFDRSSDDD
jgi:hypothetical protein